MNTTTTFTYDDTEVTIGDRVIIDGDVHTVVRIAGRWVTLSDNSKCSRAAAAAAREEYLEDEETLGEEEEETLGEEAEETLGEEDEETLGEEEEETLGEEAEETLGEEDEETLGEEAEPRDIVDPKYRALYARTRSANGNRSFDRGDELAEALRGRTIEQILNLCYSLLPEKVGRWDHLNVGQRSMNARNAIRNAVRKGTLDAALALNAALRIAA